MIIFLLILIITAVLGFRKRTFDYLSKESTIPIKGFLVLIVFFSHFNTYVEYTSSWDLMFRNIVGLIGQAMVAPFLFFSGYGIMTQIKNKGSEYVKAIPKKRILNTLIRFDVAVLMFIIMRIIIGGELSFAKVVLSLIAFDAVGNSNWYIFVTLVLYLITYISFRMFKSNQRSMLFETVLIVVYMLIISNYKVVCWYDTALCYLVGMFCALYKDKIDKLANAKFFVWAITFFISVILLMFTKLFSFRILPLIICNITLCIVVLLFSMRISIKSKILYWCGDHLFELYILQRIPMIIFDKLGFLDKHVYVGFILSIITTIILIYPFNLICNKALYITKLFDKKQNNSKC